MKIACGLLLLSLFSAPIFAKLTDVLAVWAKYCPHPTKINASAPQSRICQAYWQRPPNTAIAANAFLHHYFKPIEQAQPVLVTGYFSPRYQARWQRTGAYQAPLYGAPTPIAQRCSREQINHHHCAQLGAALAWLTPTDRFFLQIQGSGCLQFPKQITRCVGYAGRNHYPYRSIGRWLVNHKHLNKNTLSMQTIRRYLQTHRHSMWTILEKNPAFIFFQWQPTTAAIGAAGKALTAYHSIAVDPSRYPMGLIVTLHTTRPTPNGKLLPWTFNAISEDTGSAIRGANHIDLFVGSGKTARWIAGHLKQMATLIRWVPRVIQH